MIDGDTLVVDASVAVKWYVPERNSDVAARLLETNYRLLAPELVLAEFGNVLWEKVTRQEIQPTDAFEILTALAASQTISLAPLAPLLDAALEIAIHFDRPIYDAFYLALALREGCSFITADQRFAAALRGSALGSSIVLLDDF